MESKVFKAQRTLMQMLADRNYKVADTQQYMSPENFKGKLLQISAEGGSSGIINFQKLNNIYEKNQSGDQEHIEDPEAVDPVDHSKIYVCWQVEEEKVNADIVKRLGLFCT